MIDFHTHILPGIYDGVLDYSKSIEIIRLEKKNGVNTIVLTPHSYYFGKINMQAEYEMLKQGVAETGINIELLLGCKISTLEKSESILRNLHSGAYPTINGSQYILVEFRYSDSVETIADKIRELSEYKVIIAHTERYCNLTKDDIEALHKIAMLQVTCGCSEWWYNVGDIISGDCHGINCRMPNLTAELWNEKFSKNAREIIGAK